VSLSSEFQAANGIVNGGSIWPSEKYPFFSGTLPAHFFVRGPTHGLLDNDGGSELYLPALALSPVLERLLFAR
jgi:hypothetical protein